MKKVRKVPVEAQVNGNHDGQSKRAVSTLLNRKDRATALTCSANNHAESVRRHKNHYGFTARTRMNRGVAPIGNESR